MRECLSGPCQTLVEVTTQIGKIGKTRSIIRILEWLQESDMKKHFIFQIYIGSENLSAIFVGIGWHV